MATTTIVGGAVVVTSSASESFALTGGAGFSAADRLFVDAAGTSNDVTGDVTTSPARALRVQVYSATGTAWTGSLAVQARMTGTGAPWAAHAATPATGGSATSTIAAAGMGIYLIDITRLDVQFVHTAGGGAVAVAAGPAEL